MSAIFEPNVAVEPSCERGVIWQVGYAGAVRVSNAPGGKGSNHIVDGVGCENGFDLDIQKRAIGDPIRVGLKRVMVGQPHPLQRAGNKVLDKHIRLRQHRVQYRAIFLGLKV